MRRLKSEDRIVPEGRRKSVPSQGGERPGGEKAVPVEEVGSQFTLLLATADNPGAAPGARERKATDLSAAGRARAPKVKVKRDEVGPCSRSRRTALF